MSSYTDIGADSNINIQMNYWIAEMTGMDVTDSLFNYFEVRSNHCMDLLTAVAHTSSVRKTGPHEVQRLRKSCIIYLAAG